MLKDICGAQMFSRPNGPMNWDRFRLYAPRVQTLHHDPYSTKPEHRLRSDVLTLLAITRPQLELLPALSSLTYAVPLDSNSNAIASGLVFAYMAMFMRESLRTLHISIPGQDSASPGEFTGLKSILNFQDVLAAIPGRCGQLTSLTLSFGVPASALEPAISDALSALPHLNDIDLPAFTATSSILLALSQHTNLRKIFVHPFWGIGPHGSPEDVKTLSLSTLPPNSFPALQEFDFDANLSVADSVLRCARIPNTLTRLYFSAFEDEPISNLHDVLDLIATEFTALTLLGVAWLIAPTPPVNADVFAFGPPQPGPGHPADLDPNQNAPLQPSSTLRRITFDTLRPVLRLQNLSSFYVLHTLPLVLTPSDIVGIGAAWGESQVRHVRLVPSPLYSNDERQTSTTHTLGILEVFAQHLPKLEHLELYLDATAPLPATMPTHAFPALHTLDVGTSPINEGDEGKIAQYLARLVPRKLSILCEADWSVGWAGLSLSDVLDVLRPRRIAWRRVGEMHAELLAATGEREKRIRELEKEGNDKTQRIMALEEQLRALQVHSTRTSPRHRH